MKLNLGSGITKQKEGWVNLDIIKSEGVDVIHDLNKFPYPFKTGSVEKVNAEHIIEHLPDIIAIMKELHRICKNGALIRIKVPYFRHQNCYDEPTHVHFFTERSFRFFTELEPNNYCGITGKFELMESKLTLNGKVANFLGIGIIGKINPLYPIFIHEIEILLRVRK
ncbi:MAG: hypothetical protein AABY04_02085 [Candidatus Micrarchaeota archaeon]